MQSNTVRLVQLVEHQIVVLGIVGSSPTSHPKTEEMPSFLFYGERTWSLAAKFALGRALLSLFAGNAEENISAPTGPCILQKRNMERRKGRRG